MSEFAAPRPGGAPGAGGPSPMGGGGRPPLRKAFVAFQSRSFRLLWFSGAASFLGMWMMIIARGALAWDLSHSYTVTGLLSLSFGLPMLLFSLFGGATADRVEKRALVAFVQVGIGISAAVIAVLVWTDFINIPILFALGLVQGTAFAFMGPARFALLGEVVPRDQFMNAIALNTVAMSSMSILGPVAAGGLMLVGGHELAFGAMAVFAVLSGAILLPLPKRTSHILAEGQTRPTMISDVGAGLRYVFTSSVLRVLFVMAAVPALLAMPYQMLLPGFADEELGRSWAFPVMLALVGVGAMTGSFVIAALNDYRRKPLLQWIVGLGMGAGLIALGIFAALFGVWGALPIAIVLGFTMIGYQTINNTLIMTNADPQYMGRVMSIVMLTFSMMPIVAFPLGGVADIIGSTTLFMIMGGCVLVVMIGVSLLRHDQVFGETPVPPEPSPAGEPGTAGIVVATPHAGARAAAGADEAAAERPAATRMGGPSDEAR